MKKIDDIKLLLIKANSIRQDLIKSLVSAGSGHSAGPLGLADIFTALYFNIMNHNPKKPRWEQRDRLILSNGHIVPVVYSTLAHAGYFPIKELKTLRKINTRLQGHPHKFCVPGIENSAGPLGQGISVACGAALAAKRDGKKIKIYCSMGDGELDEGQVWEAFMFAANYKLDNLIAFVDRNFIQIDGNTPDVMCLEPLDKKIKSFGWNVITINGNNMKQILKAFNKAKKSKGKPTMILAKTTPGKGVSYMEGKYEWHGKPPTEDQGIIALAELTKKEHSLEKDYCLECKKKYYECICKEGE